jgi:gluconolactonase
MGPFASLKKHNIEGFPNGMAIDTDGNLKVAVFGGSKVLKIYGSEPEVLLEIVEMLS